MVHEASHWTQPPSIVFKQSSYNVFCTSHSLLIHSHNGIPACTDHQSLLPRQRLTRRANAVCDIPPSTTTPLPLYIPARVFAVLPLDTGRSVKIPRYTHWFLTRTLECARHATLPLTPSTTRVGNPLSRQRLSSTGNVESVPERQQL